MRPSVLFLVAGMAVTTYLIRMLPLTLFRKKIRSKFARSFFYYIPYAVLAAMLIPAAFFSTGDVIPAAAGVAVGLVLAYFERSLLIVALAACATAFLVGFIPF